MNNLEHKKYLRYENNYIKSMDYSFNELDNNEQEKHLFFYNSDILKINYKLKFNNCKENVIFKINDTFDFNELSLLFGCYYIQITKDDVIIPTIDINNNEIKEARIKLLNKILLFFKKFKTINPIDNKKYNDIYNKIVNQQIKLKNYLKKKKNIKN